MKTSLKKSMMTSIATGWWDSSGNKAYVDKQSKRWSAVVRVSRQLTARRITLPQITLFAPPVDTMALAAYRILPGSAFIYLSPMLEFNSQEYVNQTVAHEVAHIFLEHHLIGDPAYNSNLSGPAYEDHPEERAADALAARWGFTETGEESGFKLARKTLGAGA